MATQAHTCLNVRYAELLAELLRATAPVQNIRHARVCFRSECTASPIARPSRNRLFVSTEETQSTLVQGRQYSAMRVKELRMSTILTRNAPLSQCYTASDFKTVMDILRSTATYHSRPFPTIIQYCTSVADTASFNLTKSIKRKGLCNRTLQNYTVYWWVE